MRDYFLGPVVPHSPAALPQDEVTRVRAFYDSRPDLHSTPLRLLPVHARQIGIGALLLKDESTRFGLPAFKVVGVTYAIHRLIEDGRLSAGAVVACATAGNHGRAVARVARERGLRATVYVPAGTVRERIDAIASEGADVIVHDRGYDDAVATMARDARRRGWTIVSDTSYPGSTDDDVPRLIMCGYTRLFDEAAAQWDAPPDVMFVQAGVGGLLAAAASWSPRAGPHVVSCEPANAACVLAAAEAGRPRALDGALDTAMAGLRCAEISHAAWPIVAARVRAFVTARDEETFEMMRRLARIRSKPDATSDGVVSGPSGACGLACLAAVMRDPDLAPVRDHLGLGPHSRVLVVNTEGNTDPSVYNRVVGSKLEASKQRAERERAALSSSEARRRRATASGGGAPRAGKKVAGGRGGAPPQGNE
ncbi:MAG: diaminopropionate ammonia-lyase [Vicinamibacterales bacterium]